MITRNFGIKPASRSGSLLQWQLIALAVAWGAIFVLTGAALVQS